MTSRPHRFLQYLQELSRNERWHEVAALEGQSAGARHAIHTVTVDSPGRVIREVKLGIRLVLKWLVRALYLSPLLVILRFLIGAWDRYSGDMVVVGFVLLVVFFFLLLNVYIVWSVVEHFKSKSKGRLGVHLPFGASGEDLTGVFSKSSSSIEARGRKPVHVRGTLRRVDALLPESGLVLREFWATDSVSPWRLTESVDFAVLVEGERPVIVQLRSAPLVVGEPRKETVAWAVHRLSAGLNAIFDMGTATKGKRAAEPVHWLTLAEGDEVELIGFSHGVIDNIGHFRLGHRSCSLNIDRDQSQGPYRGAAGGDPGTLVVSTPETPVWIKRVGGGGRSSRMSKSL